MSDKELALEQQRLATSENLRTGLVNLLRLKDAEIERLRAQIKELRAEIKELNYRGGLSWEEATG